MPKQPRLAGTDSPHLFSIRPPALTLQATHPYAAQSLMALDIASLNPLPREEFVSIVGPVFEHSPWIAEATWSRRPFANLEQLHHQLCQTVQEAGQEKQLALIRAHPDLVDRAARAGSLTLASASEQASAGLDKLSADEVAAFQQLNRAYHHKFGFPFVICARLNKKEAILDGFRERLKNSTETEIKTALEEIGKIAYLRLRNIVGVTNE